MEIYLNAPITNYDNTPMKEADGAAEATLKSVCFGAMNAALPGDDAMDGPAKMKAYELTRKIAKGGTVEIEAEDITLLKSRIAKAYHFLIVGRAFELLEGLATKAVPGAAAEAE